MSESETPTVYKVAFSMLKGATMTLADHLAGLDISLAELFDSTDARLSQAFAGRLPQGLDAYSRSEAMGHAEREMKFIERHNIRVLYAGESEGYPLRLAQIASPPPVIFVLGRADLNSPHPVSVVGTRKMTPYGAESTKRLTRELAEYFPDLMVVSGLAYGVDATAHTTALECGVSTIGVVAHGLDTLYPAQHRDLARRIIEAGGAIVSQYPSGVRPYRQNFLERNRIVAGISDATIVIESELKGGAMSTARHAFEADRDLFALPGRALDPISAGCNHLIRKQRANLIATAADLIEVTGWQPAGINVGTCQRSLFPELEGEARTVYEFLRFETEPRQLDHICHTTGIPMSRLMSLMTDLEFDGVVVRHPGNRFSVAT